MPLPFLSQASPANLKTRARLLRDVRSFFDQRGFTEVQTPMLCRESVIDRHLDPIQVPMKLPGGTPEIWYLQTSPEQSMKRLLASGVGSIYQIGAVFRDGELGQHHNPEFTMAEWYDVGASHEQGQSLLCHLVDSLLGTSETIRIPFEEAFFHATGIRVFESTCQDLAAYSMKAGIVTTADWSKDWDDWVNLIFSASVQHKLGSSSPTLVTNFPASQAALAVLSEADPRTAERYEIFYRGVELANGYHELLDAEVLRQRDREANEARQRDGKDALPECTKLLAAMELGFPSCCGCALGFDRLVMLACGASRLDEVISFSALRA